MLDAVFILIGILLFAGSITTKLQMEKEYKDGATRLPNNFFLYLDSTDFSEKGNVLRKRYNVIYLVLIVYAIALYVFMKANA